MENLWCFQCGRKYGTHVDTCRECGVELVDDEPMSPTEVGDESDPQLAYELHPWSFEARRMLDQICTSEGLDHAWQGASLIVREADEELADRLVEQVERSALPTLDPELEHVVYEMDGWGAAMQAELSRRIGFVGIPHEFDKAGDLVVHDEDEEEVDGIVDVMSSPDFVLDDGDDEGAIELDGLGTNELLTRVFVSCQKLARNPLDNMAIISFIDDAGTIEAIRTPFGLDREAWQPVVERITLLRMMYEGEVADLDDDEARETAGAIRDSLHQMI
ncbi:MAG: hypothetical protein HKN26_13470 [Acidimicrobiales bacterium]|nr:hypothetical protein [Acidimicrobiales bacterium]